MEFFFEVRRVKEVLEELKGFERLEEEVVRIEEAVGRYCSSSVLAPEDLPPFPRATMDGYAVRARDTFGASETEPVLLKLVGEVSMGEAPGFSVGVGEAARIATGGVLPEGADAVVMVEYCREADEVVEVRRPVSPQENVMLRGEDVKKGEVVVEKGVRLNPGHIGLLSSLGILEVSVYRRPKVGIVSTGDELVPPWKEPPPGCIRDTNSYSLLSACKEWGAVPRLYGIVPDEEEALFERLSKALEENDVVLVSGGSSVGTRDFTLRCIERLEGAELLCHGISMRPGKPTIVAKVGNKAVFGLPGQVTSALVVFYVLVRPLLLFLQGARELGMPAVRAVVTRNLPSAQGREDYIRVKLTRRGNGVFAEPIFGKSGTLSPMAKADGLLYIPLESEGVYEGEEVTVFVTSREEAYLLW